MGNINYSTHMATTEEWWETTGRANSELAHALGSRPLSVAEFQRVAELGYHLLTQPYEPYDAAEKQRDFAALLSIQQSIQFAATREAREPPPSVNAVDPSAQLPGTPEPRD